jgi:hypothetical protein
VLATEYGIRKVRFATADKALYISETLQAVACQFVPATLMTKVEYERHIGV